MAEKRLDVYTDLTDQEIAVALRDYLKQFYGHDFGLTADQLAQVGIRYRDQVRRSGRRLSWLTLAGGYINRAGDPRD